MKFNINILFCYLVIFLSMYLIDGKKVTKCIVKPKLKTTTTTTRTTSKLLPSTTTKPISTSAVSKSLPTITNGTRGRTTRYWDCCLPSCSWKENTGGPFVKPCLADGVTPIPDFSYLYGSGCSGGKGYLCNSNQPWALNENIAFGFSAASFTEGTQKEWCCGCYRMQFTSGNANGKQMIVQIVNTGYDLSSNHFDLQIPGGGVGIFNGCESQWNSDPNGWGQRYGGVSSIDQCNNLPEQLRDGCKWRFEWFKGSDNPDIVFERVQCPKELTDKTGCIPFNDANQKPIPWIV